MPAASRWVHSYPQRLVLEPGARRTVRLVATPPANLPPGEYHYRAVAVDILSLAATSAVSAVTVLRQPPTESQTLVTNGILVRQTGLFYQTVTVSNPTATAFAGCTCIAKLSSGEVIRHLRGVSRFSLTTVCRRALGGTCGRRRTVHAWGTRLWLHLCAHLVHHVLT